MDTNQSQSNPPLPREPSNPIKNIFVIAILFPVIFFAGIISVELFVNNFEKEQYIKPQDNIEEIQSSPITTDNLQTSSEEAKQKQLDEEALLKKKLQKDADSETRNTLSEITTSFIRYQATRNQFPWKSFKATAILANDASSKNIINEIINAGELKNDFIVAHKEELSKLYLTYDEKSFSACFSPVSDPFKNDRNTKYNKEGIVSDNPKCPDPNRDDCFWCLK